MIFANLRQIVADKLTSLLVQGLERTDRFLNPTNFQPSASDDELPSLSSVAAVLEIQKLQDLFDRDYNSFITRLEKLGCDKPLPLAELFAKAKGHSQPEKLLLAEQQWWEAYLEGFEEALNNQQNYLWRELFYFLEFKIRSFKPEKTVAG